MTIDNSKKDDSVKYDTQLALEIELREHQLDYILLPDRLEVVEGPKSIDNSVAPEETGKAAYVSSSNSNRFFNSNRLEDCIDYSSTTSSDNVRSYLFPPEFIKLGASFEEAGGEIAICPRSMHDDITDPSVRRIIYRTGAGKPLQEAYVRLPAGPGVITSGGGPSGPEGASASMDMAFEHKGE
jgi:hypothetical protein